MPRQYHKNPRQITEKQFKDLRDSLIRLGDLSGIVHNVRTDEIVGGNQRSKAIDLNSCEIILEREFDEPDEQGTVATGHVVWKGHNYTYRAVVWDDKTAEEANIRANKAGGSWDFDVLANEFEMPELIEWGFEPWEFGIENGEPERESKDAEPQTSKADELREKWGVELGQVWRLPSRTDGQEHRIVCGDCTDESVVEAVMMGDVARYGLHDPPYGIDVVSTATVGGGKPFGAGTDGSSNVVNANRYAPIIGDGEKYDPSYILTIAKDNVLWGANYYADNLEAKKGWLVWDKKGREWEDNFSDCELAWTSLPIVTKILRHTWMGMVQEGEREERLHPTQKPAKLYQKIINDYFVDDGIIIDFYAGSSPTIIAAENLSRQCRAIEISSAYVAVALQRYYDAFGIEPELIEA